jgi:hypothetical protein
MSQIAPASLAFDCTGNSIATALHRAADQASQGDEAETPLATGLRDPEFCAVFSIGAGIILSQESVADDRPRFHHVAKIGLPDRLALRTKRVANEACRARVYVA